jgi:hypothetical protein
MIVLPPLAGSRATAAELVRAERDRSPIFDASANQSTDELFVDELCKQLIEKRVDRVTFVNSSESFQRSFMSSYMLRSGKFLVEFSTR